LGAFCLLLQLTISMAPASNTASVEYVILFILGLYLRKI